MIETLMLSLLRIRPPASRKTAAEIRADAEIHDKEIELTYLRQIVDIAKHSSTEATDGLYATLQAVTAKRAKIIGDKYDEDFKGGT